MHRLSGLVLLLWFLAVSATYGQQPTDKPLQVRPLTGKKAPQLRLRPDATPSFPNVNRIAYYQDKKALKEIQRAEKRKNWTQARKLLEAYVHQFGIQNFIKDTPMLWRLAQLCERTGDEARAKAYYRLALKHHRQDITKIQLYYDSLEQKTQDLYVPLKTYYDLVEYRKNIVTFHPPKGVYTSMGDGINSDVEDYGPTLNSEAGLFIFSSKRKTRGITSPVVDEDLYTSRKEGEYWTDAEPLPKPINSPYNEGSACITKDGRTIYFARCECPNCHGNCDLFQSTFQDGQWSVPKSLGANVNSTAWDSQPTLSRGEDTLYFASDRLGALAYRISGILPSKKTGSGAKRRT
ncbi:hypothetical protein [Hymenobacter radiodurans]|uniref:hypothetical protein n=1 Tax=Hymenobacter radiodurans TaxID=2496028 RepID=UPI001F0FCFA8|nr:hypothetical protein [Hymenobacter radiodurans]